MANPYWPIDWTGHPLHAAALSANSAEVERLLAAGADVNERLDGVGSPLHAALRNCGDDDPVVGGGHRHLETVKSLLAAGADVRSRLRWGGTPLHDAARFGLIHVADLLISYGADVNSREASEGCTPLHLAAVNDRLRMVEYLLAKGAEMDSVAHPDPRPAVPGESLCHRLIHRDESALGMTPLQLAARAGRVAVVRRLVEAGASRDVPTAIDWARRFQRKSAEKYDEIIALLSSTALP